MRSRSPALAAVATAVSLGLLAVAACTGGGSSRRFIPPPPDSVAKITTAPPGSDFSGVALAPVEGRTPDVKVEITGGEAVLSGLISGPEGPVAGATVRLERFVGDAIGRLDVVSNADGTWRAPQSGPPTTVPPVQTLPVPGQPPTIPPVTAAPPPQITTPPVGPQGILGGRYRVRAWKTPDLALTTPQILFLEGNQTRSLGLQLSRYSGVNASSVSAPDPPLLNQALTITAIVTSLSVNGDGIVSSVPLVGASLTLSVGGSSLLFAGGPSFTNGAGRAQFTLRCQALGASSVDLTVNGGSNFSLPVRPCVAPVTTTTSTTLFDPNASTTLSLPGSSTTRTSTSTP